MAKVIQFPSKVQINRVQRLQQLNDALDRQEQMLQEVMKELDILNEEIVTLTSEYNSMLKELKELVLLKWKTEDERYGEYRWPYDKDGEILSNVNMSRRLN